MSPKSPFGKGGFRGNVDVNGCINALAFLYQQRGLHNGRLPQNCIEPIKYQVDILMQFFAMTVLIKPRRDHTFHLSLYPSHHPIIYHAHAREGFIAKDMSDGVFSQGDATKIFAKTLGV